MKFILLNIPAIGGDRVALRPIGRNPEAYQGMLKEVERLVVRADELGFTGYATAEHHFHTEGWEVMPAPLLFYAKLAAITKQIKFIPLSLVPVAANPLRIAEETALFDQMFPGRIEVGLARGYQSRWLQVMAQHDSITSGLPESDALNREIFDEYVQVIKLAWTQDCFNFDGKHFKVPFPYKGIDKWPPHKVSAQYGSPGEIAEGGSVVKIGVVPPPYTAKELKLWVPFTLSPATLAAAAAGGYNMILNPSDPKVVQDYCRRYQEESAKYGYDRKLGEGIAAAREIVVADSADEAFDIACRGAGSFWFEYAQHFGILENWRIPSDDPEVRPLKFDTVEELTQRLIEQGWIIAGTLNNVCNQIADLNSIYGAGGSLEYIAWNMCSQGALTTEESLRQIEIVGTQIMPKFA